MVSIWFLAGLVVAVTGVVGLYVGKIFQQAQRTPVFIAARATGPDGRAPRPGRRGADPRRRRRSISARASR